ARGADPAAAGRGPPRDPGDGRADVRRAGPAAVRRGGTIGAGTSDRPGTPRTGRCGR
ncbi:hypothetical protein LTR94_032916, partial [Friedmanniomyces endolithicus]